MMMLTATICVLSGALLGIRFNIKMLAHVSLAIVLLGGGAAIFGAASIGFVLVDGIVAIIALQAGYGLTMVLGAMGHVRQITARADETTEEVKAFDGPVRGHAHLPR